MISYRTGTFDSLPRLVSPTRQARDTSPTTRCLAAARDNDPSTHSTPTEGSVLALRVGLTIAAISRFRGEQTLLRRHVAARRELGIFERRARQQSQDIAVRRVDDAGRGVRANRRGRSEAPSIASSNPIITPRMRMSRIKGQPAAQERELACGKPSARAWARGEQAVLLDRFDRRQRRRTRDRVAAERRGVGAGDQLLRERLPREQAAAAQRQPARAFASVIASGTTPNSWNAYHEPVPWPIPVCTSSKINIRPCSSASGAAVL